uniref:Uncharacterized protein n=1 Tax=Avena sativa TaxID=4498 RepID=A0ACD5TQV6_AVESA
MALLAARRAAALLRPTPAAAARFSSRPDYRAFVACLRDISDSVKADKNYFAPAAGSPSHKADENYFTPAAGSPSPKADENYFTPAAGSLRDTADSIRAATHDGVVLRVIDGVIRSQYRGLVEEISSDFPFEIRGKEGLAEVTLTRSLKGEQIEVFVSMPKLDQDEDHSNSLSSSNENEEDKGKTPPEEYSLPVKVTVSKADGSALVFTCNAYPDDIVIKSLSIRQKLVGAEEGSMITYDECPDFREVDKNLQQTFHKYLELRGITPTTTKLLHEYMISKDRRVLPKTASKERRNHLVFLTKLCNFVKKE